MLRITGGKVYDPANGINGEVKDVCISRRPHRRRGRGRPHHRRDGHGRLSRRRRRPHARRRRRAQLRPGHDPGGPPPQRPVRPHRRAPRRHRRADAHHLRHRLPLRRHGLDDGQRGGRADPVRQAHARGAARHADRRQGLLRADGQQRDPARPAGGRRDRAGHSTSSPGRSGRPRPTASRRSTPAASRPGSGARTPSSSASRSTATAR